MEGHQSEKKRSVTLSFAGNMTSVTWSSKWCDRNKVGVSNQTYFSIFYDQQKRYRWLYSIQTVVETSSLLMLNIAMQVSTKANSIVRYRDLFLTPGPVSSFRKQAFMRRFNALKKLGHNCVALQQCADMNVNHLSLHLTACSKLGSRITGRRC